MTDNKKNPGLNPVILEEQIFRAFLDAHENLRSKKDEYERQKNNIQTIKQRFNSELNSTDIAASLHGYQVQFNTLGEELKQLEEAYKPVENNMRQIIQNANGAPVIWRNIQGLTVHSFSVILENGKPAIVTTSENI